MENAEFAFDIRLDTNFLNELYEGDKEHAAMIFEQFLQTINAQMKEVDDNFNTGNSELFRQKMHKLKPVFSFVGLTSITQKAELIERQCKQTSGTSSIEGYYNDFRNNVIEFLPIIKNELNRLQE